MPTHTTHTLSCLDEVGGRLVCTKTGEVTETYAGRDPVIVTKERTTSTKRAGFSFRWHIPKNPTTPRGWLSLANPTQHPDHGNVNYSYLRDNVTVGNYVDYQDGALPILASAYITRMSLGSSASHDIGHKRFATVKAAREWMERSITNYLKRPTRRTS